MTSGQIATAFRRAFGMDCPGFVLKLDGLTPGDFSLICCNAVVFGECNSIRLGKWLEEEAAAKPEGGGGKWGFELATLEPRLIGDISGRFFVARYQRGYRWGKIEVERLLDDIWSSAGAKYALQPIVVKQRAESEWELVDGQQRLTTLYLIVRFMQRERLLYAAPAYTLNYETRPGLESYLRDPEASGSHDNIDNFHVYSAYESIRTWFDAKGEKKHYTAYKFYSYLFENVHVIWYDAPRAEDSTTLFTRLNVGRIPLTDAELVKAQLVKSLSKTLHPGRVPELVAEWDRIEHDLRHPDIWAFVSDAGVDDCPTHITLLLDALAGGPRGRERPRFYTFDTLREKIDIAPEVVWNQVADWHGMVIGWFDNRDLYHKIGYLVHVGDRFGDIVQLAAKKTKTDFEQLLNERIRDKLNLSSSDVAGLSYERDADRARCERLLLLMNVETVRRLRDSTERYSFRRHRAEAWSLEHIHAQQAESLTKEEQWSEWLRLHRDALADLSSVDPERRDALVARINAVQHPVDRPSFQNLAQEVTVFFTDTDNFSVHSVTNLALLPIGGNAALGNAAFEVKRRRILELDKEGAYIPICTRQVFLKYYTHSSAQQLHFWGAQDRESYLRAMISVVSQYLKREDR